MKRLFQNAHCHEFGNTNGRGTYYTRSRRRDGRIIREYLGSGKAARLAAREDAAQRQKRAAAVAARRQEELEADLLDAQIAEACRRIDIVVRAALIAAGFYQHNRGEWRKRRGKQWETECTS